MNSLSMFPMSFLGGRGRVMPHTCRDKEEARADDTRCVFVCFITIKCVFWINSKCFSHLSKDLNRQADRWTSGFWQFLPCVDWRSGADWRLGSVRDPRRKRAGETSAEKLLTSCYPRMWPDIRQVTTSTDHTSQSQNHFSVAQCSCIDYRLITHGRLVS